MAWHGTCMTWHDMSVNQLQKGKENNKKLKLPFKLHYFLILDAIKLWLESKIWCEQGKVKAFMSVKTDVYIYPTVNISYFMSLISMQGLLRSFSSTVLFDSIACKDKIPSVNTGRLLFPAETHTSILLENKCARDYQQQLQSNYLYLYSILS